MVQIIYSASITDINGGQLSYNKCKEIFAEAIKIHKELIFSGKKIAYFFIDPLLDSFEAANRFYFNMFDCPTIGKMNTYKSGAGPIQALTDAKELLASGLYDAAYIFGYEPLMANKKIYGKKAVADAMNIFNNYSIIQCYNKMAQQLCKSLSVEKYDFLSLCDLLYANYANTYLESTGKTVSSERGRFLEDLHGDLFKLTDCANPNIDFAGGLVLTTTDVAEHLSIPTNDRVEVRGASYRIVEGSPETIKNILGGKDNFLPHLRVAIKEAEKQSEIRVDEQFHQGNMLLEAYTCYPPIPIAFLFAANLIKSIEQLPNFLAVHPITITGGMNVARAPWNNPALIGMIEMHKRLKRGSVQYGLVHGNGGIGEVQGAAIFKK